jgi:hemerythrin superfamily protein
MGEGVGIDFTAFVKLYENYNIKEILENPDEFEMPTKLDELWSFIGAVAHYTKSAKDKKILTNALKITNKLEPEYATLLLKMVLEGKKNIKQFDEIPEFTKTITRLGKYF